MATRVKLVVFEGVPCTTGVCTRSSKPSQCSSGVSYSSKWTLFLVKFTRKMYCEQLDQGMVCAIQGCRQVGAWAPLKICVLLSFTVFVCLLLASKISVLKHPKCLDCCLLLFGLASKFVWVLHSQQER